MYEQIREDTLFIIFYTLVTGMAMTASFYLLFRDGNAFARNITPPLRLRRWATVLFIFTTLERAWYMSIFFLTSSEDITMIDLVGGLLDSMILLPMTIIVLLTMLQDRRRPLWPVGVMMVPIIAGAAHSVATRSYTLQAPVYIYFFLMCMGLIIYMVRALRQYGRWLRDNFADLEHKEVWQTFIVLSIIMFLFVVYVSLSESPSHQYAMQVIIAVLICCLLWRVETLSELSVPVNDIAEDMVTNEDVDVNAPSLSMQNNIGSLLKQHCEEPQLYLQHDLTVYQLAQTIGINRLYLSQYFSSQGMSYNAYINDLRINHFVSLYREAVAAHRFFTIQELAHASGYQSYSTFGFAFKQRMGQTVTAWMRENAK